MRKGQAQLKNMFLIFSEVSGQKNYNLIQNIDPEV